MKAHTTLSIDGDLLNQAKQNNINMSELLEWAIKNKEKLKKDLPEEVLKSQCSKCKAIIDWGYLCEHLKIVLCADCQLNFNMAKECGTPAHDYKEVTGNLLHFHKRNA